MNDRSDKSWVLGLKVGDFVEVRSKEEILATLDQEGRFENLPFMPEMLEYCGRRMQVFKRADKGCDNIQQPWSIRRMQNTVHLEGNRCNGGGHDGCEAGCLIFWKEAWLKRANPQLTVINQGPIAFEGMNGKAGSGTGCTVDCILRASKKADASGEAVYSCQATKFLEYTTPMKAWDPRQFYRDVVSGNLRTGVAGYGKAENLLEFVLSVIQMFRGLIIQGFNNVQKNRNGAMYPVVGGVLKKTPHQELNLQPGEWVQVLSKDEILATLNTRDRNRGLLFDAEMVRYCGGVFQVLSCVHHIIDEKNGKMLDMKYPCIILQDVYCRSDYHRFCPRAIWHYWREIWLRRVSDVPLPLNSNEKTGEGTCPGESMAGTCSDHTPDRVGAGEMVTSSK